ncbi:MAG: o-succinylbenzoate synthase [Anaerolineae bacterium]|nr:o-succinylbenzoate synthase [Anaerolineae bacterium]
MSHTRYQIQAPAPVDKVILHHIALPLVEVLTTSFGGDANNDALRAAVLVELHMGGVIGWGECVAAWTPGYSYETIATATHVLESFFIPAVVGKTTLDALNKFRGHPMAKTALETAFWAAIAEYQKVPLGNLISDQPRKSRVVVGVSIGIQKDIDATLGVIDKRVKEGYKRIKLKIKPGWDYDMLKAVRDAYPDILLMADANSAYTLDDIELFKKMDNLDLLMIEQPLGHDDIYQHSKLQPQLKTPICLDESIRNVDDVRLAVEIDAGRIINLKPARVGGLTESIALHKFCHENNVPLWIGGMLETGIGRAANFAVASLPGVTLPSDLSATDRYYNPDITNEVFNLNREDSTVDVPTTAGLGVTMNPQRLAETEAAYQAAVKGR